MAPRTIVQAGAGATSVSVALPQGLGFKVQTVYAVIDTTGGATTPELTLADASGQVIATKPQATALSAATTETATWALRLDDSGGASAASKAWCTAAAAAATTVPNGVSSAFYFGLTTNDPTSFAIDGAGHLKFNKKGTYNVFGRYVLSTTVLGGPVASPWTKFVQGGPGTFPGTPRRGGAGSVTGVALSAAVQTWQETWLLWVVVDAAHVGGVLNWNWQNATGVDLFGSAFVDVVEL